MRIHSTHAVRVGKGRQQAHVSVPIDALLDADAAREVCHYVLYRGLIIVLPQLCQR